MIVVFKILDIRTCWAVTLEKEDKQGEPYNCLSLLPGLWNKEEEPWQRLVDFLIEETGLNVGRPRQLETTGQSMER